MKIVKKNRKNDPIKVCSKCFDVLPEDYQRDKSKSYICRECKSGLNAANHVKRYPIEKDKIIKRVSNYYYENKEDCLVRVKSYREEHHEELQKKANTRARVRMQEDPIFKLKCRLSKYFWRCLQGNKEKDTKGILALLGYTIEDLKKHIEDQFAEGMHWGNRGHGEGKWQIDHIAPVCSFTFTSIYDEEFKKCWALSNLRPLWCKFNLAKIAEDKKKSVRKVFHCKG